MPWWSLVYLSILTILTIAGRYEELSTGRDRWIAILDLLSLAFVATFVFSYYNNIKEYNPLIIAMTVLGIAWEIFIVSKEVRHEELNPDPELSEAQNMFLNNFAMVVANLIVIPGYTYGIVLSYRAVMNHA
jgi:uncharacterized membrane protein